MRVHREAKPACYENACIPLPRATIQSVRFEALELSCILTILALLFTPYLPPTDSVERATWRAVAWLSSGPANQTWLTEAEATAPSSIALALYTNHTAMPSQATFTCTKAPAQQATRRCCHLQHTLLMLAVSDGHSLCQQTRAALAVGPAWRPPGTCQAQSILKTHGMQQGNANFVPTLPAFRHGATWGEKVCVCSISYAYIRALKAERAGQRLHCPLDATSSEAQWPATTELRQAAHFCMRQGTRGSASFHSEVSRTFSAGVAQHRARELVAVSRQ